MPPTPTSPTTDVAHAPKVGNCYQTTKHSFHHHRDGSQPVPCKRKHTTETFAVFETKQYPGPNKMDQIWRVCGSRFAKYVGGSDTVSTLGYVVLRPSVDQSVDGQTWVRCDAVNRLSLNGEVGLPHHGSLRHALAKEVPDRYRGCANHKPKATNPVFFKSCQNRHKAELIPKSKTLGGPHAKYPGKKSVESTSESFCKDIVPNWVPEATSYYYYYPTKKSWESNSHQTVCWGFGKSATSLPPI
ncbi:MAG: septum formation family protein [Nocardioidaceae bacterium]